MGEANRRRTPRARRPSHGELNNRAPTWRPIRPMPTPRSAGSRSTKSSPAKVMRIGAMIRHPLEEVREGAAGRRGHVAGFKEIYKHLDPPSWLGPVARPPRRPHGWPSRSARATRKAPATPSCGSPRRSWSAGSRGCSTASRQRCSHSRWRPAPQLEDMRRQLSHPAWPAPGMPAGPRLHLSVATVHTPSNIAGDPGEMAVDHDHDGSEDPPRDHGPDCPPLHGVSPAPSSSSPRSRSRS